MNNFTIFKEDKSKKYIPIFFAFVFVFFFFFLNYIKLNETVCYFGFTKNYFQSEYIYAESDGVILDYYIKNNQKINPNQKIYSIKKNDPLLTERENQISYLKNLINIKNSKISTQELLNIQKEISTLKNVNFIKDHYHNNKTAYIKSIYVNKNEEVKENEKIIEINFEKESKFYIETFIPNELIKKINLNDQVILSFENHNIKYTGYIEKINKNIFKQKEIKSFSGFDFPKNGYKVNIRILTSPEHFKEGHKVNFKVMKNKKSLLSFTIDNIKKAYYDF